MLIINRKSGFYIDRDRSYKIFIDKEKSGEIWEGEEKSFDLNEGSHTVRFGIDWCSSKKIEFDIKSKDENIEIECYPNAKPATAFFYIFFNFKNYISAKIK